MMRTVAISSKIKQCRSTQTNNAMISGLAKKARHSSTADAGRACTNKRDWKNKHNNGILKPVRFILCNPYIIEVDKNCYNYKEFRYLTRNCRSRMGNRIGESIKLEYRNENNRQKI